jgi:autoinducer 2-degrading protein
MMRLLGFESEVEVKRDHQTPNAARRQDERTARVAGGAHADVPLQWPDDHPTDGPTMKRVALWVELEINDGAMPAFLEAARRDAEGSVAREPGCRRFDILRDPARPNRVCFYEVYDDEAALAAHREMAHFKAYASESPPLIAAKTVTRLAADEHAK